MDYKKVDAGLAGALAEADDAEAASLTVFIHTATVPDDEAMRILAEFGIARSRGDDKVFAATLSPRAVAQLSEHPWVQSIKLSRKLNLKNPRA